MAFKRLKGATGNITDAATKQGDSINSVTRDAILVHAGPNGSEVEFQSSDGPIKFDKERIKRVVKAQNAMIEKLVSEYGGWEKIPDGAFPPVLDQHSDDSNDRIRGRLTALLRYEVRDVPKVGKNVPCAVTTIKFIGKETTEKVADGRIYHLSVGIDETTDTLGETSIVIDPAADGAMLLNKGKKKMAKPVKKLKKTTTMSNKSNLESSQKRMNTLKKMSKLMNGFATKLVTAGKEVKLAKREGEIGSKIKRLMSAKKLTPAEFKKLDIKKLAKLSDESLDTVLDVMGSREDVIMAGQRGTSDAAGVGEMTKSLEKKQIKNLKSETRKDFKRLGKKMKDEEESEDSHLSAEDEKEMAAEIEGEKKKMGADEDKDGKENPFKKAKKKMKSEEDEDEKDMSFDENSEEQGKASDKLQSQIDELTTQMSRIAGMVNELMDVEKEEGHELSDDEDEESEMAEEEDDSEHELESDEDEEHDLSSEDEDEDKGEKKKLESEAKVKEEKLKKKK
jgi:hypothetical protein